MRRRALLGGLGALAVPGAAWADCGEDDRRRLLRLGNLLVPEAQACGGAVVGPPSTSAFLTADFTSKQNYASTTTQQIVSQRMYGCYIGWGGDRGDNPNLGPRGPNVGPFSAYSDSGWTSQMAKVNPGIHMITGNLYSNGWFNNDNTVNPTAWANLIGNFYKVDPLGIAGIILGMNFTYGTPANYATAFENFAKYIEGPAGIMPNSKRLPLIGFGSTNEDGADQAASYFNVWMPKVRAVNPNYVCVGPQPGDSNPPVVQAFLANTNSPKPDGVSWDFFNGGFPANGFNYGSSMYDPNGLGNSFGGAQTGLPGLLPVGYTPKFTFPAGNVTSSCNAGDENTINGAMFWAVNWFTGLAAARYPLWCGAWDDGGQGSCGLVTDASSIWPISPAGYLYGKGVRTVFGPRWQVPNNSSGLMVVPCTPSPGHLGMMITNAGKGAQNSKLVAFSHWPVNTTGNGTANVWQMTSAIQGNGVDGAPTTIPVVNGVTTTNAAWPNGLSFPDPSITIISI